ncbi:MAG: hypothetical protein WBB29_14310 [Geitlerinemataceae cyanobacterium]
MNTGRRVPAQFNSQTGQKDFWGLLMAVPLMGLGIAIGLQSQNSTLLCDRTLPTQIECRLLQSNVLGKLLDREISSVDLGILKGVEVIVGIDVNGEKYKVVLLTDRGKKDLTGFNNIGNPEEVANRINDFILDRQERTLEIQQDNRWFSSAFGGILILTGLWKIFTFNKSKPQSVPFLR